MSRITRIVALDLSLNATGWARNAAEILKCTVLPHVLQVDTITPSKGLRGLARLHWVRQQIHKLVWTPTAGKDTLVVMEALAMAAHDAGHQRAGLAWLVRHRLYLDHVPFILVAPTTLKKFALGVGKGEKSQILKAVYKKWGVDATDDNQADAVVLWNIGLALIATDLKLTKAETEVLKTVRKNVDNAPVLSKLGLL